MGSLLRMLGLVVSAALVAGCSEQSATITTDCPDNNELQGALLATDVLVSARPGGPTQDLPDGRVICIYSAVLDGQTGGLSIGILHSPDNAGATREGIGEETVIDGVCEPCTWVTDTDPAALIAGDSSDGLTVNIGSSDATDGLDESTMKAIAVDVMRVARARE